MTEPAEIVAARKALLDTGLFQEAEIRSAGLERLGGLTNRNWRVEIGGLPIDALTDVMAEAYAPSHRTSAADFAMFVDFVEHSRCYELHYSDLDKAVELLTGLCADG